MFAVALVGGGCSCRHGQPLAALALVIAGAPRPALGATVLGGETRFEIPPPAGVVERTPDRGLAYEYQRQFIEPTNDQFSMLMPEADGPTARRSEIMPLERSLRVQIARKLSLVGQHGDFAEFKAAAHAEAETLAEAGGTVWPRFSNESAGRPPAPSAQG